MRYHKTRQGFIIFSLYITVIVGSVCIFSLSVADSKKKTPSGSGSAVMEDKKNKFCILCHELRNTVYKEYQKTSHFNNPSGVRASCSDCHVPSGIFPGIARKIEGVRELWAKIKGTIDTPEKFEKKRLELAIRVWEDMESNDSRECRSCHMVQAIDFTKFKKPDGAKRMKEGLGEGQTCINCHKGLAHEMPDMSTGYKAKYEELIAISEKEKKKTDSVFTFSVKPFFLTPDSEKKAGKILPATELTILKRKGDKLQVQIRGWQQEGVAPLIYALQGKRIFSAALDKSAQSEVKKIKTLLDDETDLTWHETTFVCWISKEDLISDLEKLWEYGAEMHNASCSGCHSATPASHFPANQWMGSLKSMSRNTNLTKEEYRFLLKYLQFHAKDTGGEPH